MVVYKLFRADTGQVVMVNVGSDGPGSEESLTGGLELTVMQLRTAIERQQFVALADQILIDASGLKLENNRPLAFYGMEPVPPPSKADDQDSGSLATSLYASMSEMSVHGKGVFLFTRQSLDRNTPVVATKLEPVEIPIPTSVAPSASRALPMDASVSPLVRAVMDYETHFQLHLTQAEAVVEGCRTRLENTRACAMEQEVQVRALGAALANLRGHSQPVSDAFNEFYSKFRDQHESNSGLLSAFEDDMSKLSQIPLHPVLKKMTGRETLMDLVPQDKMRKWAGDCGASNAQLETKVKELKALHDAVHQGVKTLLDNTPSAESQLLDEKIDEARKDQASQELVRETLHRDYRSVQKLANDLDSSSSSVAFGGATTNPLEACAKLESVHSVHLNELLPKLKEHDGRILTTMQHVQEAKTSLTRVIHNRLHDVSTLQSKIRTLGNKITVFTEALGRQKAAFEELMHIRRMPASYEAYLIEVVRRRHYGRVYVTQTAYLAEQMAKLREDEVSKRDEFFREHGRHLPVELTSGLQERPPYGEIHAPSADSSLPAIDEVAEGSMTSSNNGLGNDIVGTHSKMGEDQMQSVPSQSSEHGSALEIENSKLREQIATLRLELSKKEDPRADAIPTDVSSDLLAAKDEIISVLEGKCSGLELKVKGYEERIITVEEALAQSRRMDQHPAIVDRATSAILVGMADKGTEPCPKDTQDTGTHVLVSQQDTSTATSIIEMADAESTTAAICTSDAACGSGNVRTNDVASSVEPSSDSKEVVIRSTGVNTDEVVDEVVSTSDRDESASAHVDQETATDEVELASRSMTTVPLDVAHVEVATDKVALEERGIETDAPPEFATVGTWTDTQDKSETGEMECQTMGVELMDASAEVTFDIEEETIVKELREAISKLEDERSSVVSGLRSENGELTLKVDELEESMASVTKERMALRDELCSIKADMSKYKKRCNSLESRTMEMESSKSNSVEEMQKMALEIKELADKLQQRDREIAEKTEIIKEYFLNSAHFETQLANTQAEIESLRKWQMNVRQFLERMRQYLLGTPSGDDDMRVLERAVRELKEAKGVEPTVSLKSFTPGDLAFFYRQSDGNYIVANIASGQIYLDPSCRAAVDDAVDDHDYFIGRLLSVVEQTAVDSGSENPFGLESGATYRVVTAEPKPLTGL